MGSLIHKPVLVLYIYIYICIYNYAIAVVFIAVSHDSFNDALTNITSLKQPKLGGLAMPGRATNLEQ